MGNYPAADSANSAPNNSTSLDADPQQTGHDPDPHRRLGCGTSTKCSNGVWFFYGVLHLQSAPIVKHFEPSRVIIALCIMCRLADADIQLDPPFAWCDCSHPIMYDDGKFTRLEGSFPQAISHDDVYHHIKLEICERGGSPADLPLDAVAAVGGGGSLCAPRLPPQVSTGRVAAGFSAAACCGSCHSRVRRPAHVLTPGRSFSPTPSLCPHSGVTCASFAHKTHFIATFDIREEVNRNMPLRSRIQTPVLRYC